MKTPSYNPSPFEIKATEALEQLQLQIASSMGMKLVSSAKNAQRDNPEIVLVLEDADGDAHEMVFAIIQRPDRF